MGSDRAHRVVYRGECSNGHDVILSFPRSFAAKREFPPDDLYGCCSDCGKITLTILSN